MVEEERKKKRERKIFKRKERERKGKEGRITLKSEFRGWEKNVGRMARAASSGKKEKKIRARRGKEVEKKEWLACNRWLGWEGSGGKKGPALNLPAAEKRKAGKRRETAQPGLKPAGSGRVG